MNPISSTSTRLTCFVARWLLATTLIMLCSSLVHAEDLKDLIKTQKLANGLEVIVIQDHSLPLVTIEIAVKNGAYTEPAELNGLSHLFEHMFFKGNAVISTQEDYLKRMRELGIVFNGTTSTERVNYYFTLPSKNAEDGIVFMKDAITTLKFDEQEFKKEIQVVIGEVDRNESNPYYWLNQAMNAKVWHAHPTRKDSLGDRKTITTATTEKMRLMKERYYVPNNSVLVIAGDIEAKKAFAMAKKAFSTWTPSTQDPHVAYPVPMHPAIPKTQSVVVTKKVRNPFLQIEWHGPSVVTDPKATYAADVLSYILGQPTSKFHKTLVESGTTLGASLGYYTQRYTGPINASAQLHPDKIQVAIKALLEEVYKLSDPAYFSDEQLASAKKILAVQSLYQREVTSSLAHTVSFWWCVTGKLDYYLTYVDNLNAVTREDIARFVSSYILNKPFVAGLLLSKELIKQTGMTQEAFNALVVKTESEVRAAHAKKNTAATSK